ncbi:putative E3 ubiquitin-protein ligase makorin-1 isoform X2 [Sminthopsis crassicaudata]|uniref:putative E3 ubiquitin-protein ligase makorin-1 isoform X2 n=1 Tax=Sminthopsis crassicaudata TaxID=9301 RepID=UPI003D69D92D
MADSGGGSSGSDRSGSNDSPRAWGRQSLTVCRYFQQGFCFRGNDCRYQHSQAPGSSECTTEPPLSLPEVRPELMPAFNLATLHSVPEEFSPLCAQYGRKSGMKHLGTSEEVNSTFSDPLNISLGDLNLNSNLEAGTQSDPSPDSFPDQNVYRFPGTQTPELMENTQDVVCGICMEKVWDKPPADSFFAILPNCSHAYCVKCLRTWRQSWGDYPKNIIKACPECRVHSNYFVPYKFWVSKGPEKEQLIKNFKDRTSQIHCKFFIQRKGRCPFKSDCIYQHQFPKSWTKDQDSSPPPDSDSQ